MGASRGSARVAYSDQRPPAPSGRGRGGGLAPCSFGGLFNLSGVQECQTVIVAILNPKGGSGKTTLSANLARAFVERGDSVLLVDSDPQGSLRDWHAADADNPLSLVALDRASNVRTVSALAQSYSWVIIDGAAKLEDMLVATIKVADLVLIPVQPSPYDVWGVADLVELVGARQEMMDGRPRAGFVVNRRVVGTRLAEDLRLALGEYPVPILGAVVGQRQIYPQSAAAGRTVFDSGGHQQARAEIEALAVEVCALLDSS